MDTVVEAGVEFEVEGESEDEDNCSNESLVTAGTRMWMVSLRMISSELGNSDGQTDTHRTLYIFATLLAQRRG